MRPVEVMMPANPSVAGRSRICFMVRVTVVSPETRVNTGSEGSLLHPTSTSSTASKSNHHRFILPLSISHTGYPPAASVRGPWATRQTLSRRLTLPQTLARNPTESLTLVDAVVE